MPSFVNECDERSYIKDLAAQVMASATEQHNQEVFQRWRDVNALRQPDRAPVWCRPVGAWDEILPPESLSCSQPELRPYERYFRQILIKKGIGDDSPIKPYFPVNAVFDCSPPNQWGIEVKKTQPDHVGGAWSYDPALKTDGDFEQLQVPRFAWNRPETERRLEEAHQLFGDEMPIRLHCGEPIHGTLGTYAAELRGLTEIMMDTILNPELLHRLMSYLRDAALQGMADIEASGLLTTNYDDPMTCSEPFGPDSGDATVSFKNRWAAVNSQEFDPVSPEMWNNFCLEYQKPLLEHFGYTAYGCCENLTQKLDGVLSIPNLRIISCSAWTDLDTVIDKVQERHVIMWRQKASDVVFLDDTSAIKEHLEQGARKLKGCHYQIVLRELQTLAGHPDRLYVWTDLAKEAAAKFA